MISYSNLFMLFQLNTLLGYERLIGPIQIFYQP